MIKMILTLPKKQRGKHSFFGNLKWVVDKNAKYNSYINLERFMEER
jgi:hypothetical protein